MRFGFRHILFLLILGLMPVLYGQKPALLLIDIQEFYFPGGKVQLEDPEMAGMHAGLVLEQFRNHKLTVIHVKHEFEPGGEIHSYVKPQRGETVISKNQVNAFLGTGLREQLMADSITRLVICGMQTHMCVEAAVRAAHDIGFECILVSDACATRAVQYQEHIIPAKNVHYSTIQSLQDTYATVTTTDRLLRDFNQLIYK